MRKLYYHFTSNKLRDGRVLQVAMHSPNHDEVSVGWEKTEGNQ